jgi:hypothetical protein
MKVLNIVRTAALLLACCLLLCACASGHKLSVNEDDTYTDRKTGVTYRPLSACYEPASVNEEYAYFKLSGLKTILYTVGTLPPEQYLSSAYYGVYANASLAIPSVEEMQMTELLIYTKSGTAIPVRTLSATDAAQSEMIESLRDAYLHGTRLTFPSYYAQKAAYTLRFAASNLPELYFCISYVEFGEDVYDMVNGEEVNFGRYFLYDRYNKVCVAVDDTLHNLLRSE